MEKTLNQLMLELQEIASQHRQINEFFQGDFLDAISRDAVEYPLMVATLQPGGMDEDAVRVNVVITICDKYNHSNYRQINEVHSDCLSICNDLNVTFRQYRWTEFADILTEIGTDPFINEGQDMVAGWTMNISFSIFNEGDWCAIPYDSYDFENGYTPPGAVCDDANYSITDDSANVLYSGTIASGGSLNQIISDSTAVLKNTADTILSTTSINAEGSADIVAPDAHVHLKKEDDGTIDNVFVPSGVTQNYVIQNNDISVNGVFEFDIHATDPLDIRLRDTSDNVITPVSVTDSGMHATIVLPDAPAAVTRSTATLMKTGQTTSYRTGDDGDLEAGRATDFLTLDAAPVHNDGSATINLTTNRFTDINGLQVYGDNIVLDWSTWNGSTLLGWFKNSTGLGAAIVTDLGQIDQSWDSAIDGCLSYTNGSFTTGWRCPNITEMMSLKNWSTTNFSEGSGLFGGGSSIFWTSTTAAANTAQAYTIAGNSALISRTLKTTATASYRVYPVRTFSLSTSNVLS